ncbi:MAG TPA: tetratricopeptide repeat protein [Mucilaginibacter sp.]
MKYFYALIFLLVTVLNASAQQKNKNQATPQHTFDSLFIAANHYGITGKYDSLPGINRRLLALAQKTKDDSLFIKTYIATGNYFARKGDYSQALAYEFKALGIAENSSSRRTAIVFNNIAAVYTSLENYPSALLYLRKGVQNLRRATSTVGYLHTNLARTFAKMNKPDSALKYAQLALADNIRFKDSSIQPAIYLNFAVVYEQLNEPELVNYYYKKSMHFSDSTKNAASFGFTSELYSKYLLLHKNYPEAKKYALISFKTNRQIGSKKEIIESSKILYNLYADLQLHDSAFYYLKVKDLYQDSVLNEQKTNQLQALIVNEQIKENEQAAILADDAIQRRNNVAYAAIAIALISFVIIFLLLSRSIIVSTKLIGFFGVLGLLVFFEFINLIIHPYLSQVTNGSPVLMLLVLVIIAALIVPLHHKLEHWITHKLVEKNKAIRLAAAKKTIQELEGE